MPDSSFHEGKIDEILDAYSDSLFIQGVCLFYIGVHAVDYVLAGQFDIEDIATHRGRKKRITENMDWETSESFAKLLTYSLAIRYNEISSIEIIEKMKESLKELIMHLEQHYNFPVEIREKIFSTIK